MRRVIAAALLTACGAAEDAPVGDFEERQNTPAAPSEPPAEVPEPGGAPAPATDAPEDTPAPSGTRLAAVNTLGFTRRLDDGSVPGFNLDDRVSDGGDRDTCGKMDYVSPDGTEGVDNQLATLVPLFEGIGIGALEGLVQNSIKEGGLLIMLETSGVDDEIDDPSVDVTLRFGQGTPLLGTDGLLLSGQTFHPSPDAEVITVGNAKLEGGVLSGGPFEAVLPVVVFGIKYVLPLHNARLTAVPTYDGGLTDGLLGGEVAIDDLMTIANQAAAFDGSILAGVTAVLNGRGDLARNEEGVCTRLSGAFTFGAVSAFFY